MDEVLPKGYFRKKGQLYKTIKQGKMRLIVKAKSIPSPKQLFKKKSTIEIEFTNWEGKKVITKVDKNLYNIILSLKEREKKGFDGIGIGCGPSGTGKSTVGFGTILPLLDPSFKEENIYFSVEEFMEKAPHLPDGSGCQLDEGQGGLNSRKTGDKQYLQLINFLSLIRQKKLKIFLIIPDFFQLSAHLAIYRSNYMILTYANRRTHNKGFFLFYDSERKKSLYINGKRFQNYSAGSANFKGHFMLNEGVIDTKSYLKRKRQHLLDMGGSIEKNLDPNKDRNEAIYQLSLEKGMTQKKIGQIFNLDQGGISKIIKNIPKNEPNIPKSPVDYEK